MRSDQRRALLLGLVEVILPVSRLDEAARARVFLMCHTASTAGHVEDPACLGRLERGIMGVEVFLDQQQLIITSDDVLVSCYDLADGFLVMPVQRTEGHLVFLGFCRVRRSRLSAVLDLMSDLDAQHLQDDIGQRLSQLASPSIHSSTPQGTQSIASPCTTASDPEQDPSIVQSHRPGSHDLQHVDELPAHTSVSPQHPVTPPLSGVARPRPRGLPLPHPFPAKPVYSRTPAAVDHPLRRPPSTSMPATVKITATPLCLISCRPASLLATRPVAITNTSTTATVSSPLVSTATLSATLMSSLKVSTSPVSTPMVSTLSVSTPMASTQSASMLTTSNGATNKSKVSTRQLPVSKAITPLAFIPPVSTRPVSTPKVSVQCMSTPKVSIRPISIPKVFTSLVLSPKVSATPVSTSSQSTSITSIPAVSTSVVATLPISTAPVTTSTVSITAVPKTLVISLPTPVSTSVPPTPILSSSVHTRQSSMASSNSQDEDSNISENVENLPRTLKVEDSEHLYIPVTQPAGDPCSFVDQQLCSFLVNEREYLNTLERIAKAKKDLTSELQNLLRGIDRLADFHDDLYRGLYGEYPSTSGMAKVLLSHREELEQYRYYMMNAPQVTSQLGQQTKEIMRQHPTLEADIKSTWKRIHFYFMTFERLAKIMAAEEQELVQEIVALLQEINRQGDSGILIDAVSGAPFNLHTVGKLLLHSLFTVKDSSGMLSSRIKYQVLLFEEIMVIGLPKKEKYQYKDHLPLRQLNLHTQMNSDKATFTLELVQGGNKRNKKYTFRPREQEIKDVWVAEISRLHLKYEEDVERVRKLRCGNL